ncbi:hypothetical protein L9F63_009784, partial [Diploptera punctata]
KMKVIFLLVLMAYFAAGEKELHPCPPEDLKVDPKKLQRVWIIKAITIPSQHNYGEFMQLVDKKNHYEGYAVRDGYVDDESYVSWIIEGTNLTRQFAYIYELDGVFEILLFEENYYVDQSYEHTDRIYFHIDQDLDVDGWEKYLKEAAKKLCLKYEDFIHTPPTSN